MRRRRVMCLLLLSLVLSGSIGTRPYAPDAERLSHSARHVDTDLTVVTLNILHGFKCDAQLAPSPLATQCRLAERIDLLMQWLEARGCPDIVTLQEVIDAWVVLNHPREQLLVGPLTSAKTLLERRLGHLAETCGFRYQIVYDEAQGIDEELILTRYPVLTSQRYDLHSVYGTPVPFFDRHVLYARIDHPIGPVDVFTTHLSSTYDLADTSCEVQYKILGLSILRKPCPAECIAAGARTVRACQAVQLARYVAQWHDGSTPAVITGDLNALPESFEYRQLIARGYVDVYRAGGNPECQATTGIGCTAGRESTLAALESPAAGGVRRIDYIFLRLPTAPSGCAGKLDAPADHDGDGIATRVFTDIPNPFTACGSAPLAPCWPSDHGGVELDLNCPPS